MIGKGQVMRNGHFIALQGTLVLIILDGWGHTDSLHYNPIASVHTPNFDRLIRNHPHGVLNASGACVGLPDHQMGNSEVGHLHIGAGRCVPQNLTRINCSIEDGTFFQNLILKNAVHRARQHNTAVHVVGLLSEGGVHSHERHIFSLIEFLAQAGVRTHYLHAILDGRDVPPKSAFASIERAEQLYKRLGSGCIASLIGRYYAMDRDQRWARTERALHLYNSGLSDFCMRSAFEAVAHCYDQNITDEFMPSIKIQTPQTEHSLPIQDQDVVIFMNFRADRMRQLLHRMPNSMHTNHPRHYITLTEYDARAQVPVLFKTQDLPNTLGAYIAAQGLKQLRIAETEKYAHVTYFFNGGSEAVCAGEERILIPSPSVSTYDLQPEMSAQALTDELVQAILHKKYHFIVANYANPDMVGHTGHMKAAEQAVSVIDQCIGRVVRALADTNGEALITADHGNVECMYDTLHNQPHTAHTTNPVPVYYFGRPAVWNKLDGNLQDIAPTVLHLLGLNIPKEMTGQVLFSLNT